MSRFPGGSSPDGATGAVHSHYSSGRSQTLTGRLRPITPCSACALIAVAAVLFLPETGRRELEDIAEER